MKVKIFTDSNTDDLEKMVNAWMGENQFEVFEVLMSKTLFTTIAIFYRKAE